LVVRKRIEDRREQNSANTKTRDPKNLKKEEDVEGKERKKAGKKESKGSDGGGEQIKRQTGQDEGR